MTFLLTPWLWGKAEEYLPWQSWGGTEHLENKQAARDKYEERIRGWSDTAEWGRWLDADRLYALDDARKAYSYATNAEGYWARVASLWEGYAQTMSSIHPEQFTKILAAVGASKNAATTYRDARNWVDYVGDIAPKPADVPWWTWGVGAVVVWTLIRK